MLPTWLWYKDPIHALYTRSLQIKKYKIYLYDLNPELSTLTWGVISNQETLMKLLSVTHHYFEISLRSVMTGSIVSSVIMSQPSPLQIALGVFLGKHKMLITELHEYGMMKFADLKDHQQFIQQSKKYCPAFEMSALVADCKLSRYLWCCHQFSELSTSVPMYGYVNHPVEDWSG